LAEVSKPPSRHSILAPGNLLMLQERERLLVRILRERAIDTLAGRRVFEAGCGGGYNLRLMLQWGAHPGDLAGIDLDEAAVEYCHQSVSDIRVHHGSAATIPEAAEHFDLSIAFTLFSSVPSDDVARQIGAEIIRVTRPGGLILVYDMRRTNPWNPAVHKVVKADIRRWFPGCRLQSHSLTLLPQVARPIGRFVPALYGLLSSLPPLRTHAMYVLQRPAGRVVDVDAFARENASVETATSAQATVIASASRRSGSDASRA
jgi:SAM-dependent methyltransferase